MSDPIRPRLVGSKWHIHCFHISHIPSSSYQRVNGVFAHRHLEYKFGTVPAIKIQSQHVMASTIPERVHCYWHVSQKFEIGQTIWSEEFSMSAIVPLIVNPRRYISGMVDSFSKNSNMGCALWLFLSRSTSTTFPLGSDPGVLNLQQTANLARTILT